MCQGRTPACARNVVKISTVAAMKPLLFSASSHTIWPGSAPGVLPNVSTWILHSGYFQVTLLTQGPLTAEALRLTSILCSKSPFCTDLWSRCHNRKLDIMGEVTCLVSSCLQDCQFCEQRAYTGLRAGTPPLCSQPATIGTQQPLSITFPSNLLAMDSQSWTGMSAATFLAMR